MAVPTLALVTPGTIFTGGMLVTLAGANFQVPYPIPDSNGVLPDPLPTVQVLFNGVAGSDVRVYSAVLLTVIAPANDPGTATVTIKNLNSSGSPIPGEVFSLANAVTYARADLSVEADFSRLNRVLIKLFKQQTIANVVMTTSVDYSDQAGEALEIVAVAHLPCIQLSFPKQHPRYGEYAEDSMRSEENVGINFSRRSTFRTVDLTWQVRIFDNNTQRSLNLVALVQQFLKNNLTLSMDRDPADLTKGKVEYELEQDGDFVPSDSANNSDVVVSSSAVTLRGFWFEDIASFPESAVVEKGQQADTITVGVGTFDP